MKLQFKHQQYQTDAVNSVVNVFEGQPNRQSEYTFDQGRGRDSGFVDIFGYDNARVQLTSELLATNISRVQQNNHIRQTEFSSETGLGCCQLDVEMETGTGKTYVYIKTMYELNRKYGWTKFIVVVPSVAIREGVAKSFAITAEHFMELYGKKIRYFIYDSSRLNQIEAYSTSADLNVMIINAQAFNTSFAQDGRSNKARLIIHSERDEFGSRRPIDVIKANRPILILDEPQKLSGRQTQLGIAAFNPLFTVNYSATHKQIHSPVYVLDALDAYNQKLVKQIEVVGIKLNNLAGANGYVYLSEILLSKNAPPRARLEFEVNRASGVKREFHIMNCGDSLQVASGGMNQYKGFTITDIQVSQTDSSRSFVEFENGVKLALQEGNGEVNAEQKARVQIHETIKAHFNKEARLFQRGIKCLSLFFLDEVANYRQYNENGEEILGRYGQIFEEEYAAVLNESRTLFDDEQYDDYLTKHADPKKVHKGYFSIDRRGRAINSSGDKAEDISAYELIMKNKERLLSFNEPVRFIFSHSALSEGWDNPNIFQVCMLRQSGSDTQRRQQVGRGLRLCVNSDGIRQDSEVLAGNVFSINNLTVVASESYAEFAAGLQRDIAEDLYERPKKVDVDLFKDIILKNENGEQLKLTIDDAQDIIYKLRMGNYITKKGEILPIFRQHLAEHTLPNFDDNLEPFTEAIYQRVQSVFDASALTSLVANGSKVTPIQNKLNANFHKKEFQELWSRIHHKYAYKVEFNSEELIEKAVIHLNDENHGISVSQLTYVVQRGSQNEKLTAEQIQTGNALTITSTTTQTAKVAASSVKYDLIGKIAADTRLTRRTVGAIITKLRPQKFAMYQQNPEEFIRKVVDIILDEKATMIVEHITYNRIDGTFESNIFTEEFHKGIEKAYQGKKSIVDYVFTDGTAENSVEKQFGQSLETNDEVVVYAKLPKGFYIPTPLGNYTPDWAIAFEQGSVKHIYFVAETKGTLREMELRPIEFSKIRCAEKLFGTLSSDGVKYGQVRTYEDLLNILNT